MAGDHDHSRPIALRQILDARQRVQAIQPLHPDVEENGLIGFAREFGQASLAALDRRDMVIVVGQDATQRLPNGGFIVDN